MKTKILTLVIMGSSIMAPKAQAKDFADYLLDYGLPCVVAVGAGILASKTLGDGTTGSGLAIGSTGCVVAGSVTWVQQYRAGDMNESGLLDEQEAKVREMIKKNIDAALVKNNAEMEAKLEDNNQATIRRLEEIRKLMREVVAERIIELEVDVQARLTEQMKNGDFLPELEKKLMEKVSADVKSVNKAAERALIEKVVEEVIQSVTAAPVGVPAQ